ncbi:DNA polymerase III delta subunit (EC [Olavius algarvensis associated proteobacterium Delta 3]|nr:DNA polymerase III delta subunit (EC [Olavius algarvensis associated proteobacterium Delta 3]
MTEISYKEIETHIQEADASGYAPIYLIYGDELLVAEAYRSLLDAMIPEASRSLNFEAFDGMDAEMPDILERLNTFSLLGGTKVVALVSTQLFDTSKDLSSLLTRARQAADANDNRKAARYLLSVLSIQGLTLEDLKSGPRRDLLKMDASGVEDGEWLDRVITFCREHELSLPEPRDQAGLLQETLGKGFPAGNHLVITTDRVDRRKKLYSAIDESGIIVDCSIPKGDRRADRQVQGAVLKQRLEEALRKQGKTMSPGVFEALYEKSGFDLRTFTANIEKLIDYTGDLSNISPQDVESVLTRTKRDPIYEFTNAVTGRDMEGALFFMTSLLDSGEISHPLQLLAAVTNQIRKLILIREFIDGPNGGVWHADMPFQRFRQEVMPRIQDHDASLTALLEGWARALAPENDDQTATKASKTGKRRKKGVQTDLYIAPNPKNAYPVYLMMKKAGLFSKKELLDGYAEILEADVAIKTGGHQARGVLERLVMRFTGT